MEISLEKIENLTGYRLIRIHLMLFCVCIFQQQRYLMEYGHFHRSHHSKQVKIDRYLFLIQIVEKPVKFVNFV